MLGAVLESVGRLLAEHEGSRTLPEDLLGRQPGGARELLRVNLGHLVDARVVVAVVLEVLVDEVEGVQESAVIGVPHPDFGEAVVAIVAAGPGAVSADGIIEALAGKLAKFKQPKSVLLVSALPRNSMGKVQKAALRKKYAGLFTWILTALGASLVFFFKSSNRKILDVSLGFTGGVMIAASFWSLLSPAIEAVEIQNELGKSTLPSFLPPAIGFFFGAFFMYFLDKSIPHLHIFGKIEEAEGPKTDLKKTSLLVLAIAIHNIPEGLAVGVAFGALASPEFSSVFSLGSAVALGMGIGIQNFPEGFAVSMPLRRAGFSKIKSWKWGQLSAIVEPIFAIIGAAFVMMVYPILPYALAFAAGAMIFIVVEEVIPESQRGGNTDLATMGLIGGFIVMMCLDVALG